MDHLGTGEQHAHHKPNRHHHVVTWAFRLYQLRLDDAAESNRLLARHLSYNAYFRQYHGYA